MDNILTPYQSSADIRNFSHFNISHSWVIGYNMNINIGASLVTCTVPVFALLGYIVVETNIELTKKAYYSLDPQKSTCSSFLYESHCVCDVKLSTPQRF